MMTGSFRRAHLRGSDELFRPTQPGVEPDPLPVTKPPAGNAKTAPHAAEALGVQRREGRLVRLSDEEVELLTDALQHLKYPTTTKPPTKPPMEVFERLEELRRKLVDGTG